MTVDVDKIYNEQPNRLVPIYLMSAFLYEHCNCSVISDGDFDKVCKYLIDKWDIIEHQHKECIDYNSLHAGSGLGAKVTNMIIGGACSWYEYETGQKITHLDRSSIDIKESVEYNEQETEDDGFGDLMMDDD